jgi:DeoR family deoxyribose operon repressor
MAKKADRIEQIVVTLKNQGVVSVKDLSRELSVTEMTIRRDLHELAAKNMVKILHGGVIYISPDKMVSNRERIYSYDDEITKHTEEKSRIGKKAASLVVPHDTIIIDAGSTTEYVAKHIGDDTPVMVLAFTLNTINIISSRSNFALIVAGGSFHRNTLSFVGSSGIDLIKQSRASKAFISASGVSDKLGVTSTNLYEIEIKKAVIKSSETKVLLVDSSKFDQVKIAHIGELKDFDIIITDTGVPQRYVDITRELGIQMYCV